MLQILYNNSVLKKAKFVQKTTKSTKYLKDMNLKQN